MPPGMGTSSAYETEPAASGRGKDPLRTALYSRNFSVLREDTGEEYHSRSLHVATMWSRGQIDVHQFPGLFEERDPTPEPDFQKKNRYQERYKRRVREQMRRGMETALDISQGHTLHEYHVNLESTTGRHLKAAMNLPYEEHSRVDIDAVQDWAEGRVTSAGSAWEADESLSNAELDRQLSWKVFQGRELTAKEQKALDFHASNTHANNLLKQGVPLNQRDSILSMEGFSSLGAYVDKMDQAVGASQTTGPLRLWRGYSVGSLDSLWDEGGIVGKTLQSPGYLSTSYSKELALRYGNTEQGVTSWGQSQGGYLAEVIVPEGMPAYNGGALSRGNDLYKQVIMPRDIPLQVVAAEDRGSYRYLKLQAQLPPSPPSRPSGVGIEHPPTGLTSNAQLTLDFEEKAVAAAKSITKGSTLNELHVNLETKVGGWLKRVFKLPFQKHSRTDPGKTATWIQDFFNSRTAAQGGVGIYWGWEPPFLQTLEHWRGLGDASTGMGQTEIRSHGYLKGGKWVALVGENRFLEMGSLIQEVAAKEGATDIVSLACNPGNRLINFAPGQRLIYGLGFSRTGAVGEKLAMPEYGFMSASWEQGVVLGEGNELRIWTPDILKAAFGDLNPEINQLHHGGEIELSRTAEGKLMLGIRPALNEEEVVKAYLGTTVQPLAPYRLEAALEDLPYVSVALDPKRTGKEAFHKVVQGYSYDKSAQYKNFRQAEKAMVEELGGKVTRGGKLGWLQAYSGMDLQLSRALMIGAAGAATLGLMGIGKALYDHLLPHQEAQNRQKEKRERPAKEEHRKDERGQSKGTTHVHLHDAELKVREVDSAFAHYFKSGYAYSSNN